MGRNQQGSMPVNNRAKKAKAGRGKKTSKGKGKGTAGAVVVRGRTAGEQRESFGAIVTADAAPSTTATATTSTIGEKRGSSVPRVYRKIPGKLIDAQLSHSSGLQTVTANNGGGGGSGEVNTIAGLYGDDVGGGGDGGVASTEIGVDSSGPAENLFVAVMRHGKINEPWKLHAKFKRDVAHRRVFLDPQQARADAAATGTTTGNGGGGGGGDDTTSTMSAYLAGDGSKKRKHRRMSARDRRKLNLYDVRRSGGTAPYAVYEGLHRLWTAYVEDALGEVAERTTDEPGYADLFNQKAIQCDLHGALLTVVQATGVSLIGQRGIVVKETENTFVVATHNTDSSGGGGGADGGATIKVWPKRGGVFELTACGRTLRLYGNQLLYKPSMRSTKKFKSRSSVKM